MKIAFGTVVYKECLIYAQEFIESINNQDSNDFDMVLLNDNLSDTELKDISKSLQKNLITWYGTPNSLPSELRVQLIKNAKVNGYDLLIFGDFDDTFSPNRVSKIKSHYEEDITFFYNDLYYFDDKQKKFFNNLPQYLNDSADIVEQNYLGLSNTALNMNAIEFQLIEKLNQKVSPIFDWYLYSILLQEGHRGKKVNDCYTYYRIYDNNIAGESKNNLDQFKKEINIKIAHYTQLSSLYSQFDELLNFYKELKVIANEGEVGLSDYIERNNVYWWGRIKSKKNLGVK